MKSLLFSIILLFSTSGLLAQATTLNSTRSNSVGGNATRGVHEGSAGLGLGVSAGTILYLPSGAETSLSEIASMRPGVDLGFFAQYNFGEMLGLEIAPSFQTRNWVLLLAGLSTDSFSIEDRFKQSYLNIPLLLNFKLAKGFDIALGPNFAYMLAAKAQEINLTTPTATPSTAEDVLETFNRMDIGINLGLGFEMNNGLGLNLRTNMNLLDVLKEEDLSTAGLLNRNMTVQLSARYKFIK